MLLLSLKYCVLHEVKQRFYNYASLKKRWRLSQDCNKPNGLYRVSLETHLFHISKGLFYLNGPRNKTCSYSNQSH